MARIANPIYEAAFKYLMDVVAGTVSKNRQVNSQNVLSRR